MEEELLESDGMPITAGAIVASALVAGALAFLLRRALSSEEDRRPTQRFDADYIRDRAASVTNELLRDHLAPEIKPVLLVMLRDVREYVDRGFQRAEHALKDM